jgi:hypothetical protein
MRRLGWLGSAMLLLCVCGWAAAQEPTEANPATTERRAGYDWWSLQAVQRPKLPAVKNGSWARNAIDRFILAKLEAHGLAPAAEADSRTLVRRLYFDLIGLPPAPEEIEAWTRRLATSEAGYRELVDHLLDSPHYGERWARHWLDVVRFGESQGFERNLIRENAWRYRDWVIHAFNADMPYDDFVRRQIAGDVLYPGDLDALIATGYHVVGTWDQVGALEGSKAMQKSARQDHLEDLVATLGQAFLGLTINCARCHDHKFDPISQKEYYQIAALLSGVSQQEKEREGIAALLRSAEKNKPLLERIEAKERELAELESAIRRKYEADQGGNAIEGLQVLYVPEGPDAQTLCDQAGVGSGIDLSVGGAARFASPEAAARLTEAVKASNELTVEAWITPAKESQSGPARIVTLSKDSGQRNFTLGQDGNRFDIRLRTTKTNANGLPSLAGPQDVVAARRRHVVYTFDRKGTARLYVDGKQAAEREVGGDLSNWDDGFRLALGDELTGERRWDGEFHFVAIYSRALPAEQVVKNFASESRGVRAAAALETLLAKASPEERARHAALTEEVGALWAQEPGLRFEGPAHVIVPQAAPVVYVLRRGDARQPTEMVSPAGLRALSAAGLPWDFGLKPDAPEDRRRAKLAEWLTSARNPLTARVLVNRLWHYHFGTGLVATPSDFGFNGGRPSHPELLDYLAGKFMDEGWSIKGMQRLIVTSAAYRQHSNVSNPQAESVDGDNRLLWRVNRRRLEGEVIRDAVLAVSGALNPKLGGPSYRDMKVDSGVMGTNSEFTDPTGEFSEDTCRRTIYRLWARSGNNPMLESLDCPDPSVMSPQRTETITPVQALSLLNNAFMEECAKRFAERVRREAGESADAQVGRAYALALARAPRAKELEIARTFVQRRGMEQFCLVLLNTNAFLYVD